MRYPGIPVNSLNYQTSIKIGTGGTASFAEQNNIVEFQNGSSDYAWTIPPDSSVNFPHGSWMILRKTGTGEITVTKGSGVTFRGVLGNVNVKIDSEDGDGYYILIEKTDDNEWLLIGNIKAV